MLILERLTHIDKRLDGMDKRLEGVEQRLDGMERSYQELDRNIVNLHTDLTDFRSEAAEQFRALRQEIVWLTEKWIQHDKEIYQLKSANLARPASSR